MGFIIGSVLLLVNAGGTLLGAIAGTILLARPQIALSIDEHSAIRLDPEYAVNRFGRMYVVMYAARAISFGLACALIFGHNALILFFCPLDEDQCNPWWIISNVVPLLAAAAALQIGDIVVGVRNRIRLLTVGASIALALHLVTALVLVFGLYL